MSSTGQIEDRRQHRRLHVGGRVTLNHAGERYKAFAENISMGGFCTSSDQTLPPGTQLTLDIPLPTGKVVMVPAEVVRSYIGGAAMRFHWPGEDDRSRLLLQAMLDG